MVVTYTSPKIWGNVYVKNDLNNKLREFVMSEKHTHLSTRNDINILCITHFNLQKINSQVHTSLVHIRYIEFQR